MCIPKIIFADTARRMEGVSGVTEVVGWYFIDTSDKDFPRKHPGTPCNIPELCASSHMSVLSCSLKWNPAVVLSYEISI